MAPPLLYPRPERYHEKEKVGVGRRLITSSFTSREGMVCRIKSKNMIMISFECASTVVVTAERKISKIQIKINK